MEYSLQTVSLLSREIASRKALAMTYFLVHTKTPDGEAEGFFAVGVRVVFYQIVYDLGSEEVDLGKFGRTFVLQMSASDANE